MMKKNSLFFLFCILLMACETEFTPDIADQSPSLVVEGYIEAGEDAFPPYILLTKTTPFFSTISEDALDDLFVHDANVSIFDGNTSVTLTEQCYEDLPPAQQEIIAASLGLGSADSVGLNFCVYIEASFDPMMGEEGKTYELNIEAEGKQISAMTSIPLGIPLDSVRVVTIPGNDEQREVHGFMTDIPDVASYYRYFTQRNEEPLYPGLASVIDDVIFDGQSFEFPITRGQARTEPIDINTYGNFSVGDTVLVKFTTIDQAHYEFWSTLEYNTASDGPFSSFTKVASNIEGGLGVWGGYFVSYGEIVVE